MFAKQLIIGTSQYSNAYCMWMATPAPKTYQMLKMLFTQEYQLLNQMKHTTQAAVYHRAHFASEDGATGMDNTDIVSQQLEEAASQFAVANAQGQQTMAQLTVTNAQLQQQVKELQTQSQMNTQMMMMAVKTTSIALTTANAKTIVEGVVAAVEAVAIHSLSWWHLVVYNGNNRGNSSKCQ
eukprot:5063843-Ditylum_brightwellii.AAC.1